MSLLELLERSSSLVAFDVTHWWWHLHITKCPRYIDVHRICAEIRVF